MKRKTIISLLCLTMGLSIVACGKQENTAIVETTVESTEVENTVTEESKVELLPWLQLSSLETHPELRTAFEELVGVTGTTGNKEGILYLDAGSSTNQNNTLLDAMKNTTFRNDYLRSEDKQSAIETIANNEYTDIEDNQSIPAVINAYFELLPDQEDGQFDGDATISRAQAMALLMRATTPVNEAQAPETDSDFTAKVGETIYTDFAAPMNDYCYINTSNGLNEKSFESTTSRGEYIYLLTKSIFSQSNYNDYLDGVGMEDESLSEDVKLTTVKDGGNISLQDAINNVENGLPTDMYQTLARAVALGFITEDNLNWDEAITKSEAVTLFIDAVEVYQTNTGSVNTEPEETNGNTAGDLYVPTEEDNQIEDEASQAIAEATKADEQLQSEAGQTTSEESNYTVTPMTATLYAQQAVNLRQGPGTNYDKTGSLSTNQSVEVTGYTDVASGKWYQLSNGSFVSSKYLKDTQVSTSTTTKPSTTNTNNTGNNNGGASNNTTSQPAQSSEEQTASPSGSGDGSGSSRENRAGSTLDWSGTAGGNLQ